MTVDFQEHFWSDKQNGFDILYQNLKCGSTSAKELADFLRIRTGIEEYNFNLLIKLSRKTSNAQFGTFQPLWTILKSSTEKLSSLHMQTLQRLNQLIKEVTKYCEDHHKKQKQIKTEENPTIEAINELKETIAALNKAKEFYYAKTVEVERLKRENASQKDIEKAEIRVNKACGEYKTLIEKYRKSKDDYEKKFRISCKNFQKLEEDHLRQMKEYLASYFQILESGHTLIGQVHKEFQNNCKEMTSDRLLEMFIKSKGVGATKPADIQFEEANPSNFQQLNNMPQLSVSTSSLSSKPTNSSGYTSAVDLFNLDLMTPQPTGQSVHDFAIPSTMDPTGGLGAHQHLASTSSLAFNAAVPSTSSSSTSSSTLRKEGFLRSKKTKESRRNKGNKKESEDDDSNNGSITGSKMDLHDQLGTGNNNNSSAVNNNNNNDYMIDAEGYTVRPVQAQKDDERFYSSSDSESDSEDEKEKKIFVKINPLKNGAQISASVDQLIASAGALTLAPPSNTLSRRANLSANPSPVLNDGAIKRSVSANQSAFKPSENDLFDIFHSQQQPSSNGPVVPRVGAGGDNTTGAGASSFANSFDPLSHLKRKDSSAAAAELANKSASQNQQSQLGSAVPVTDRYAAFSDLFLSPSSTATTSNTTATANTLNTTPDQATTESNKPPLPLSSEPSNILPLPPKASNLDSAFNNSFNSLSSSALSKSLSSTSIMGTTPFSVYKPSLSKSFASSTSSNGMMSRAESISSLSSDFRMTPISLSSRDPSPLTIGMSDTLPIAIAFQESIGACFKGADENLCKINVIGCIKIAFSSGIIQLFSNNPHVQQLSFRLKNISRLDRIILSKELVTQIDTNEEFTTYEMNMANLQASLRRLSEQSPNARYYNLDMFKYQLRTEPGAKNAPLQMVSYWKCEETTTNLKIDFKFNASAFPHCNVQSLKNVQFTANVDGNVSSMTSQPEGKWDSLTKQAMWKFNELGTQTDSALGSIKAKFDLISGPTCPSSTYVQFTSTDNILSGLEFELLGSGYRLSMVKRQFSSGRYYCEPKVPM